MDIWKNSISREHIENVVNSREKRRIRTMDYFSDAWSLVQQDLGLHIGFSLIIWLIMQFISIFANPLFAGWFIAAHMKRKDQPIELGTFMKSFDHYGGLILYNLLMFLIFVIPFFFLMVPGFILVNIAPDEDLGVLLFFMYFGVLILALLLLSMFFIFAPVLIVFSNLDAWTAMTTSFKVVKKNMGGFLGFFIMIVIMHILGIMTCCLSYLVILPVIQVATYFAYEDIFKPEMSDEMDDIIRHLV
jgi:uncharacterized membrane protein